jgi:hypothetical protein
MPKLFNKLQRLGLQARTQSSKSRHSVLMVSSTSKWIAKTWIVSIKSGKKLHVLEVKNLYETFDRTLKQENHELAIFLSFSYFFS